MKRRLTEQEKGILVSALQISRRSYEECAQISVERMGFTTLLAEKMKRQAKEVSVLFDIIDGASTVEVY